MGWNQALRTWFVWCKSPLTMNIQVDSLSSVKKKISVQIPEERIQQEVQDALDKAQKKAVLPGFRPGKAPRAMLEKKYGKALEQEACQDLLRTSITQAIQDNKLDAITISEVSEPKREIGKGLTFTASIEVRPEIEPKKYDSISIKGTNEKVKDADIENVLKKLQDNHSILKPKEASKPAKGDYVSILVERVDDKGNSIETEKPTEQLHLLGQENARPEIDEAILKMNVDDFQEVTLEQPATEHNHAPGEKCDHDHGAQKIPVRITLKSVKTKELPEVNDDFAKTVGPFENLEALKKQISEDLEKQMLERNKVENVKALVEELLKNNPVELPDTLVENELVQLRQEMFQHMINSGVTNLPTDFSEEKMNSELRPEAQRRVHEQLVLNAIAKKENIDVTPQEINNRIEEYSKMLRKPAGELRRQYMEDGRLASLQFQILAQKTLDFLLSRANIK